MNAQMGTFLTASVQDLKRLLELFPVANLRPFWSEFTGTKEELCQAAAETKDFTRMGKFLDENFGSCKQHVYVFHKPEELGALPETLCGEPPAAKTGDVRSLFVMRITYSVVLRDPAEDATIDFLWPICLEMGVDPPYVIVRFVVHEKSASAYFDRPCYVPDRSIEEKTVLKEVEYWAKPRADLHKAIKSLWNNKFMDSPSAKLKKALSMAQEVMDAELGIREHNPELFLQIQESMLLSALFVVSDENCGCSAFSAKPSEGYLAFPKYSENGGTDFVISEILKNNQ